MLLPSLCMREFGCCTCIAHMEYARAGTDKGGVENRLTTTD